MSNVRHRNQTDTSVTEQIAFIGLMVAAAVVLAIVATAMLSLAVIR